MKGDRPKSYAWRRFWCPRDAAFSFSDGGYLYDPESEYGRVVNPHVVTFGDICAVPCLALLGEPGIGKSTALQAEYDRLAHEVLAAGESLLRLDLKEYASDVRLIRDSFESDTFRAWLDGSHVLHLFFDSLDEGCLEIRNLASVLAGQLKKHASYVSRLRLRIACRTSDWPASLESALHDLWGEEAFRVY
jgi:predicted NACHT family NTPase